MICVLFLGPSAPRQEIEKRLEASILPPAAQGDVHRAVRAGARTVQAIGVPEGSADLPEADAVVVALKSRTTPPARAIADSLGAQCAVIAIDAAGDANRPSGYEVRTHSGTRSAGLDAAAWASEAVDRGAGEILLTSFDRDGTRAGYDLDLLRAVRDAVPVPIIVSGGASSPGHMAAAISEGADAVLAASIFHQEEWSVGRLKDRLSRLGAPVRR